ncbi:MAG: ABC transporter permease [Pseudomonadales bacterium]|nr:ABC transporter permease [Pseudomonadales bacterium]MCP5359102.1 ABC transporter permease [Pseudomonadales bacterium]
MPDISLLNNYLRVGLRSLRKDRVYSAINIAGLSIGIACCLILGLYLRSALNYDAYHEKRDRLYRIVNELSINAKTDYAASTSTALGPMMSAQHPEIEAFTRFEPVPFAQSQFRGADNQAYAWDYLYYADPAVLRMFSFDVLYGNPETALVDPNSIAVSERFARRYFGDRNPVGEQIRTESDTFRIDLVFADQPETTHLKYDALLSYNFLPVPETNDPREALWNISPYTYLLLKEGVAASDFSRIGEDFFERNMLPLAQQLNINARVRFNLEPVASIHLHSTTIYDAPRGNITYVYAFGVIAFFVLLVACINYVNLATARSTRRAKEVGMRKVMGATRIQLLGQFIGESLFYVLVSFLLALLLSTLVIQFTSLSTLLNASLPIQQLFQPLTLLLLIGGAVLLGLVSGLYPALYLSSIPPVAAFRGVQGTGRGGRGIRQALVLLQFVISIAVIASTLLMLTQMRFVQNKALGFERDNRLLVRVAGADLVERLPAFMTRLRAVPGIEAVANTNHVPGRPVNLNALNVEDNDGAMQQVSLNTMNVRPGLIGALGMHLVEGRDFDENRENDMDNTAIVNQALVRSMGWDNALGKRFQNFDTEEEAPYYTVIGVVEDFHYAGLQQAIVPLALRYSVPDFAGMSSGRRNAYSEQLVIHVGEGMLPQVLDRLETEWRQFDPNHPFEFRFLNDTLNELYGSEQRLMQQVAIFSGLCILISCLGLFGLSAFNTAQRTREIGIRKVLGASTGSVIVLLFRNILGLVAIAAVLASLLSFWAVGRWLQGFYYRIELLGPNLLLFVTAALLAIVVAFVTMALQSWKTAQANPVLALRHE